MGQDDNRGKTRWISVWDLPTRIFHWLLAVAVIAAYLTSSGRPHGLLFAVHVGFGYAVVLLVLFRLAWGFVGGEYARFASFVRAWPMLRSYGLSLLRFAPQRAIGHNPIGGWMVILMLATLVLLVLTGLLGQGITGGTGPLSGLLPQSHVKAMGEIHKLLGNLIIYLAVIHIAGVVVESLLHRDNLARAMVTGRKRAALASETDARTAPAWRAIVLVLLALALGGYMVMTTHIPETVPSAASHAD
ncbi:MAG TPA: cytochrome b/b6 domain-containing protein [Alphaproteobacteria bacterium]|nr:cytochrome b/b6 domain-containing protein [Alphaproteobacteria bacterium]